MCGIVAVTGYKKALPLLINGLEKLEYRGYDSAGLATLSNNLIDEKKCSGRVDELEKFYFSLKENLIIQLKRILNLQILN